MAVPLTNSDSVPYHRIDCITVPLTFGIRQDAMLLSPVATVLQHKEMMFRAPRGSGSLGALRGLSGLGPLRPLRSLRALRTLRTLRSLRALRGFGLCKEGPSLQAFRVGDLLLEAPGAKVR